MTPVFEARDGRVYYRGDERTPEQCAEHLSLFRRFYLPGDRAAKSLADELEQAMRAAGYIREEVHA